MPDGPNGLVADLVERELDGLGIPPQRVRTGGLRVVTTIDPVAQRAAVDAVTSALGGIPDSPRAALVAVEPASGAVRAYYGGSQGRGFFDDAMAPRRPGQLFMPITLAEGLGQGIAYDSTWDGRSPRTFADRGGVPLANPDGRSCTPCGLDMAMAARLNTPFYALAEKVGPARVAALGRQLGVPDSYGGRPSLVDAPGEPRPGRTRGDIALGHYPVAVGDLASVYATFAAGGVRSDRYLVGTVTLPGGGVLYRSAPRRHAVLDPAVAADVSHVLAMSAWLRAKVGPFDTALAGSPVAEIEAGIPIGEGADVSDLWYAGYHPELAAVAWIGREPPGPLRDGTGHPLVAREVAGRLGNQFLSAALAGRAVSPPPPPAHVGRSDAGELHGGPYDGGSASRGRTEPVPVPDKSRPDPGQTSPPPSNQPPVTSSPSSPVKAQG